MRAVDVAGNTDATPAQSTWSIDTVAPNSTMTFPASGASYRTSTWNTGCATAGLCGTYSDATSGVQAVEISIRRGTGNYWNGTAFRKRLRGLPDGVALGRQLVVRVWRGELPG